MFDEVKYDYNWCIHSEGQGVQDAAKDWAKGKMRHAPT